MNEQRRQAAIEAGARVLAGLEEGQDWPTNESLGGSATGTRDDEYRHALRSDAAAVIDAALPHLALGYIRLEPGAHAVVTTTGGEVRLPIPGTYALVPAEDDE